GWARVPGGVTRSPAIRARGRTGGRAGGAGPGWPAPDRRCYPPTRALLCTPFRYGWVVPWTGPSVLPGSPAPSRSAFILAARCAENVAGRSSPFRTARAVPSAGIVMAVGLITVFGLIRGLPAEDRVDAYVLV